MAESAISSLQQITSKDDIIGDELFVLQKGTRARSMPARVLTDYINREVEEIKLEIEPAGGSITYEYDEVNHVMTIHMPNVNGVKSVTLKSTAGLKKTYNVNLESGGIAGTFVVNDGKEIYNITRTGNEQTIDGRVFGEYSVNFNNNTSTKMWIGYGKDGVGSEPGDNPPNMDSGSGAAGSSPSFARADHRHPLQVDDTISPAEPGSSADPGTDTHYARADHVHPSGNLTFQVTLTTAGWSNKAQTISDARFVNTGYAYFVSPDTSSGDNFTKYNNSQIYAEDVSTNGSITFHCGSVPSVALTVNVMRMVVPNEQ